MSKRSNAQYYARKQQGYVSAAPLYALGGLNEDENSSSLKAGELRRAYNCARKGSMLGTRPGVAYETSTDVAGLYYAAIGAHAVQGIHEYSYVRDANRKLVVVCNGSIYTDETTTVTKNAGVTITSGDSSPNLWTFADYQEKMFAAGGKTTSGAADSFWVWDGDPSGADNINLGLAAGAKYVFAKWNFLFLNGMNGTSATDGPMITRYNDFGTDATVAGNWSSANVIPGTLLTENFGLGSSGSEYTTGLGSFQGNGSDLLLVLTNKRIFAFVPNPAVTGSSDAFVLNETVPIGCVGQHAFVDLGVDVGDSVYLSSEGVHALSQSLQFGQKVASYLSWPIRRTWDRINRSRLQYATGTYWPNEGVVLFAVATGSNTYNDTILCLDMKGAERLTPDTVRWYIWPMANLHPNILRAARDINRKAYIYVGGSAGEVVRFDRNVYSDLTTGGINVEIQTKDEDFGLPSRAKHIGDTFLALQGQGSYRIQHQYVLDDGSTVGQASLLEVPNTGAVYGTGLFGSAVFGSDLSTRRQRVPGVGASVTIGHRFSHSAANEPFWVGMIDQQVFVSGPTDDADANTVGRE